MKRLLAFMLLFSLYAQSETLKIGIKPSEPWVMYDQNVSEEHRKPIGFSIDLWNKIAQELKVDTQWVYYDSTSALVDAAKNGDVDAAISAVTITSSREKEIDFSSSMYELGLQVMVDASNHRLLF